MHSTSMLSLRPEIEEKVENEEIPVHLGHCKTLRVLKSRVSGRVVKYQIGSGRVSGLTYVVING